MDTQFVVTTKAGLQKIGRQVSDELPKVKDATINLRDRLNDMLLDEKQLLNNYQTAINEMINDDLRDLLVGNRNSIQGAQIGLYNDMFNLGEYQSDVATVQQVSDTLEIFSNYPSCHFNRLSELSQHCSYESVLLGKGHFRAFI
jgi:hypothetical protein